MEKENKNKTKKKLKYTDTKTHFLENNVCLSPPPPTDRHFISHFNFRFKKMNLCFFITKLWKNKVLIP